MKSGNDHSRLFWILLLGFVWALENWITQAQTLTIDIGGTEQDLALRTFKRSGVRLLLNILACTGLVLAIRSRWLIGLFLGNFALSISLLGFHSYFHEPLTWNILSTQSGEAIDVTQSAIEEFRSPTTLWLLAGLILKVGLLELGLRFRPFPENTSRLAFGFITGFAIVATTLAVFVRPMKQIRTWHSFGYTAQLYGYINTWIGEIVFLDANSLKARADKMFKQSSDHFGMLPLAAKSPRAISLIQAESLDYKALSTTLGGEPLMPFLSEVRPKCAVAKITPFHFTGSSDADFTFLMTVRPNGIVAPYKVPGFDFTGSVVRTAQQNGYRMFALHGNRGTFFSRRSAFRQMGFNRLYFEEDLPLSANKKSLWGIPDDIMLGLAAKQLSESETPLVTLTITLTTHHPFRYLPAEHREVFKRPTTTRERYFNNMRYLDRVLADHVNALPDNTLLFIYGDHASNIQYANTDEEEATKDRFVPFIVLEKGGDLSALHLELNRVVQPTSSHLDAAAYFRRHLSVAPKSPL